MQSDELLIGDDRAAVAVDDHEWLIDVLASLRAGWWLILGCGAVFMLAGLIYLWNATYNYTVALRVSAAQQSTSHSPGLGSLGGLAAFAGVSGVGTEAATPFKLYLEGLQSLEVARRLSQDGGLMHKVFAHEWDARAKRWHQPASMTRPVKDAMTQMLGLPVYPWTPPGAAEMQAFLASSVNVDQNIKTPLVTISMESPDPAFAVEFLTKLHLVSDQLLRDQSRARTESNVAYLRSKVETVSLAEYRLVLFNAIADQVQQMMLVNSSAPFAAEPFGPAAASLRPTSPRPFPTLVGAVIAGLFLGAAVVALFGRFKRRT